MQQTFDSFGQPEQKYIILCNPDQSEIYSLGLCYNAELSLKFNTLSEFKFTFPKSVDGNVTTLDAYDFIQNKRLVLVEGIGYFQITNPVENNDGSVAIKEVECKSQESELVQKRVTNYGGTNKLWDILDSTGTILQDMIDLAPTWSVDYVSPALLVKFRTFDVSDSNIYNFLTTDVANAFECIFVFNTFGKTISAYTIEEGTTTTDIFLSFNNVISKADLSEKSDEITTALSVFGDGNLNINLVNPLGTSYIYNFDYYKTTDWMSQGLVDAITAWDSLVDSSQTAYANGLTLLSGYNSELLVLNSGLATLNTEYLALEGVQKSRIQQSLPYSDVTAQMTAKQAEIDAQELLITNKQTQINSTTSTLQSINSSVSFDNNFAPSQILELNNFIYENTYQNTNIIQTDSMTTVEIQAQAQELYDQAQNVLGRISQPRYEFSIDVTNYIDLQEYQIFTNQTELGCMVTAEIDEDTYIETVLLEINLRLDDPSNFSLTFSNRLRLDNENFTYSDLNGQVVKTGNDVSFDGYKWSNWFDDSKDDVTNFITSALDATTNNIISNANQEILINQNGLRARNSDGAGGYNPKQAWLVNNVLAFSDDGFQTSKLALGEINLPEGGTAYGLVADVIVGRLLAGTQLTIENEGNNFVLDSTGATLNNAKFSIQTTNTQIIIDPTATDSFLIKKNEGGTFVNKFRVTNAGDIIFSGTLSGATGTFSGSLTAATGNIGTLVIDANGLKTASGTNYLRGDGSFKWGGLTVTSGGSATFNGAVNATTLTGNLDWSNLTNVPANKVSYGGSNGTLSGSALYGGTPSFSSISSTGSSLVVNGALGVSGNIVGNFLTIANGSILQGGVSISGSLVVSGGSGISLTVTVTTPFGTRYLGFSRGVLISYSS